MSDETTKKPVFVGLKKLRKSWVNGQKEYEAKKCGNCGCIRYSPCGCIKGKKEK